MRLRDSDWIASRWVLKAGLQMFLLLCLQSCKNDRNTPGESLEARTEGRAVFGSPAPPASSPPPSPKSVQPDARSTRARRAPEPAPAKPAAVPNRRSAVGDPGERVAKAERVAPMPERFLHYRPPGSSVGDAGELSPGSRHEAGAVDLGSIRELLRRWADTLLRGDLRGHVSLYAPAGRDTVLARKQQLLNGLPAVRRFEVYDLQLQQSRDGSVQAKFRVASDAGRSLEGRYVLELRRIGGAWRIVAEQR